VLEQIQLSYPSWFLFLCLLAGLVFTIVLYWKESKLNNIPKGLRYLLYLLRFSAIAGLCFLLLGPFIKTVNEQIKKPIVVFAQDISTSINLVDAEGASNHAKAVASLRSELQEEYELVNISFGEQVQSEIIDSFPDRSTNIAAALKHIDDNYSDQNLGAIILSSDGIFNEGVNPIYQNTRIKAPLYAVALGDSTIKKDLLIKNVFHNRIAYLGDKFTIQTDIQANNAVGTKSTATLYVVENGNRTKLESKAVSIDKNNFFKTIDFEVAARQAGTVQYYISLSAIANEISATNNRKNIYIEVLDARQKILLLADAPHPDITTIKQVLEQNKNYELEVKYAKDPIASIRSYDFVILHNLPSADNNIDAIYAQIKQKNIATLFIVGNNTAIGDLNKLQDVVTINKKNNSPNETQAAVNKKFSSFIISEEIKNQIGNYPPVFSPFGEFIPDPQSSTILYQKIKDIETDYPLLIVKESGNRRTGVLAAEGIWKWRLYNHLQYQNHETIDNFLAKVIQYLSVKEDKRKFRSYVSKNIFKENESIFLDAQLYNDNYELINEPEVNLIISNSEGKKFNYTFSRTQNYYSIDAGRLPPGKYSYNANTNYQSAALSDKGKFTVQNIELEQYDLTARHGLLQLLSQKYGGKVFYPDALSELSLEIQNSNKIKPVAYYTNETKNILNYWWIFAGLILMLAIEWFIRRYYGAY